MRELKLSVRRQRRRPGRAALGIGALALGIGSATAAFTAVDAVLLEPLPIEDQARVVVGWHEGPEGDVAHIPYRARTIDRIADAVGAFERVGAFETQAPQTVVAEDPTGSFSLERTRVAHDFFGTLGAVAATGRLLTPEDDRVGAEPVAVLSRDVWVRRWGGAVDAVGDVIDFDQRSFRVVGVAPDGLDFPRRTDVWTTYRGTFPEWQDDRVAEVDLLARLAADVTVADAAARTFSVLSDDPDLARTYRTEPILRPIADVVVGPFGAVVWTALVVALLLLVVAAANASLLFLSGGVRAARELAVRRALGAGRRQAAAPLAWDACVQGALGIGLGSCLAWLGVRLSSAMAPAELPHLAGASVGGAALVFAAAVGAIAMLAAAGGAAWWLSRAEAREALAGGRLSGSAGETVRRAIAGGQLALAVVAAVGAGLLVRTVDTLVGIEQGFEPTDLYVVRIDHGHGLFDVPESYVAQLEAVTDALAGAASVRGATVTVNAPLDFNTGLEMKPRLEGQSAEDARANPWVSIDAVLPGFFDVLGMTLEEGRVLERTDRPESDRVVVVNRAAVRTFWPDGNALGRRVALYPGEPGVEAEVVGVVSDSRYRSFPYARPAAWVALRQYRSVPPSRLLVRAAGPGVPVRDLVAQALDVHAPDARPVSVDAMEDVMAGPLLLPRFARTVLLALAGVTLLLAALGVYGVFGVLVEERSAELGLRRAVGAQSIDLVAFVLRRVLVVAGFGAATGALLALIVAGSLEALVYGIGTRDGITLATVVAGVLGLAVIAAALPAVRATRADPVRALRSQ